MLIESKGKKAGLTKILFILHRAYSIVKTPVLFGSQYEAALAGTDTGKGLGQLRMVCGLTQDDIYLTNLVRKILPKDQEPDKEEYKRSLMILEKLIQDFEPRKIVAFGHIVYKLLFPESKIRFQDARYHPIERNGIPIIVSHHPSRLVRLSVGKRREHYQSIADFLKD